MFESIRSEFIKPMLVLAFFALMSKELHSQEGHWTQFRGPDGSGVIQSEVDLTRIGDPQALLWRTPIRGVGWSSTVTDGTYLWLTSAITTEATAEEKRLALEKVLIPEIKDVAGSVELIALCMNASTGQVLWEKSLDKIEEPSPIHPMNSYASPTPLVTDDRVVFHFGGYGTWCLDKLTGKALWHQQLAVDDSVGPGSSPIRFEGLMIVACDGIDQQFVAAISLEDGSVGWKANRPPIRATNPEFQKAYSTALLIEVAGRTQLIVPGAQWLVAYEPATGREIWRADCGDGFSTTPMPLLADGLVWFSTGYTSPELIAVDPNGVGDISQTHIKRRQKRGVPTKPSFVSDPDFVYMISDDGILSACSVETGEVQWRKRIGGMFSASPIRSEDQVFVASHDGQLIVFKTGNEFIELSNRDLAEQVMASPMLIGNDVILRTKNAVYRYGAKR